MASHDQATFHPNPPARTSTLGSHTSTSSPPLSPTASHSSTEDTFFGAITARMRRIRSRSRTRTRSKSPMTMPPQRLPSSANTHARTHSLSQQDTAAAAASARTATPSTAAAAVKPQRPSLQGDGRRMSGGDPWRGRHSNSWLFNDFSVTGTAKSLLERRKS